MKHSQHPQGSFEWHRDRLGYISASNFHRILGGPKARQTYFDEVQRERAIAQDADSARAYINERMAFTTPAMTHGHAHEDAARAAYELETGNDVSEVGFISHDKMLVGASLDGVLVTAPGNIEIKCPFNLDVHVNTIRYGMPMRHLAQVQGGIWLNEAEFCDFLSYSPHHTTPLHIERVPRDDEYIAFLANEVLVFAECLLTNAPLPERQATDLSKIPSLF